MNIIQYTRPYGMCDGLILTGDGVAEVRDSRIVGELVYDTIELWWQGPCLCHWCGHKWHSVIETDWNGTTPCGFECPACGKMDGMAAE